METIEYRTMDKSTFGPGPWQGEPDKKQWLDKQTGLPCLIVRNKFGSLCGYVGVNKSHPWYNVSYSEEMKIPCDAECNSDYHECTPECKINVHGGLTYSDHCDIGPEQSSICHRVGQGEDDDIWWFGFDTGHAGDLSPGLGRYIMVDEQYRDFQYVTDECTNMARQLKEQS